MSKAVKEMVIDEITARLGEHRDVLIVDTAKVDAFTANQWRLSLRQRKITALTVRNTLARKALAGLGVSAESVGRVLQGPSTLVFGSEDIVSLAKEISKDAKEITALEIKGGAVEGGAIDAAGVESLSKSPGRAELISMIAGQLLAPGANLAAALGGPGSTLASQLKTIYDTEDEAGSGEEAAAAEST